MLSILSTLAVAITSLVAALAAPIEGPSAARVAAPDVQLRFAETNPAPGLTRIEGNGRILYLQPEAVLSTSDIASAALGTDPFSASPVVELTLTPIGRDRLARATTANVGRILAVLVDDTLITAPIIREPILGGRVQISGLMTVAEATDLARLLGVGPRSRSLADALQGGLFR
ncbi:preprotein translocase subunit SecD [Inquilinus ginsengisoli]|uniref:SecDF P1 head subdomain-containing protein n=1 Tax=Inquilinus ginsengisoli TaxID=363840 RepID=UPI003D1CA868